MSRGSTDPSGDQSFELKRSQALGIGESAARVRSHRGMNELRALLGEPTESAA
jgi:hypothetical protein